MVLEYMCFSTKHPGGGVFISASLKMNEKQISLLEIGFHWSWVFSVAETKSKAWYLRKPQGSGVFIFASLIEKNGEKKSNLPGGFVEKPL